MAAPEVPACLGPVRWSNAEISPLRWGMSLQQFETFLAACRAVPLWAQTALEKEVDLYEIVEALVKPWTRRTGCSVALRMQEEQPLEAELMVSHSWAECMDQCSEALATFCLRRGWARAVVLWFCAFAQYQPGDEPEDTGPTVAEQLAMDPFGSVIRSLQSQRGMVVVQTSKADVYSRLWCVYEIVEAVSAKVEVHMAYSKRALDSRAGSFEEMLRARTATARCSSSADEVMIRKKVEETGGFNRMDSIIFDFRLRAFQEMMHELQESTREMLKKEIRQLTADDEGYGGAGATAGLAIVELQEAAEYQAARRDWLLLPCLCLAFVLALPFLVLCAPCILLVFYRRRAMSKLDAMDTEVPEIGGPRWGSATGDKEAEEDLVHRRLARARSMAPQLFEARPEAGSVPET